MNIIEFASYIGACKPTGYDFQVRRSFADYQQENDVGEVMLMTQPRSYPVNWRMGCKERVTFELYWGKRAGQKAAAGTHQYNDNSSLEVIRDLQITAKSTIELLGNSDFMGFAVEPTFRFKDTVEKESGINDQVWVVATIDAWVWAVGSLANPSGLQTKTITITTNESLTITPDFGFAGIGQLNIIMQPTINLDLLSLETLIASSDIITGATYKVTDKSWMLTGASDNTLVDFAGQGITILNGETLPSGVEPLVVLMDCGIVDSTRAVNQPIGYYLNEMIAEGISATSEVGVMNTDGDPIFGAILDLGMKRAFKTENALEFVTFTYEIDQLLVISGSQRIVLKFEKSQI